MTIRAIVFLDSIINYFISISKTLIYSFRFLDIVVSRITINLCFTFYILTGKLKRKTTKFNIAFFFIDGLSRWGIVA